MTRLPLFVGESGPTNVAGTGNYVRSIRSPEAARDDATLFNLYFLDSHANAKKLTPWGDAGYDYLKPDQINWFRGRSSQMQPLLRPYTPPRKLTSTKPKKTKPKKKPSHKKPSSKKPSSKKPKPHRPPPPPTEDVAIESAPDDLAEYASPDIIDERSAFIDTKKARRTLVDLEKRQDGWWDRLTGGGVSTEVEPDDGSGVVENPDDVVEFDETDGATTGEAGEDGSASDGWNPDAPTSNDDTPVDDWARPSAQGDEYAAQGGGYSAQGDDGEGSSQSAGSEGDRWAAQQGDDGEAAQGYEGNRYAAQGDEYSSSSSSKQQGDEQSSQGKGQASSDDEYAVAEDGSTSGSGSDGSAEDGAQGTSNPLLEAEEELLEDEGFFEPTELPAGPTALNPLEAKPNAIVFFHIPLRTAYDAEIDVAPSGKRLRIGQRLEGDGASKTDSRFFEQAILAQGELPVSRDDTDTPVDAFWDGEASAPTTGRPEVKVLAHGHCHISSDCRRVKGVWICFGGGATVRLSLPLPSRSRPRSSSCLEPA